ncbi:MAG TPA: hypothetical protein VHU84_14200 [Lacipirellulaceae bacterium]|jgi:hypothetical protein|nr:hypothetical protein [Lacipirellulaceae bacterium]
MTSSRAQASVAVSFVIISTLGAGFLFAAWASRSLATAEIRSTLFIVVMACVHIVGYILYAQQDLTGSTQPVLKQRSFNISPRYAPAFGNAICFQAILGILTALLLDGGRTFSFFAVAFLAHWVGILLVVSRRPAAPTEFDLSFIRIGILPILLVTSGIAPAVWTIIGESDLSGWQRLLHT